MVLRSAPLTSFAVVGKSRMSNRFLKLFVAAVLILVLLVLIGLGVAIAGSHLWAQYHFQAAEKALEQRDFEQARAHLAKSLKVWPRDGETHFLAARAARRAGDYDDAENHLHACKRLDWVREAVAFEWALLKAQRDGPAPVQSYLMSCVHKDHPDTLLILEALSRAYLKFYELAEAKECLDLWLLREPDSIQALLWRAEVKERLRDSHAALDDYRRVVDIDADRQEARLRLGELLLEAHRPADAVEHFEYLYQRQPDKPAVLRGLARCRYELGRAEEARELLDELLQKDPHDPPALAERGKLALQAGQLTEAENWLRQAVTAAPFDQEAVFNFCQCLRQRGQHDEAKVWQARLERIETDLKRVSQLVEQIVQRPKDPSPRQQVGAIMLSDGQEKEGLRWLLSAHTLDRRHQPTNQTLAGYFESQGDKDKAAYHCQLAGQDQEPGTRNQKPE